MINEYRVKKIALCNTPRIIFFPQKKKEKKEKENLKENTPTESRTGNGSKKKTCRNEIHILRPSSMDSEKRKERWVGLIEEVGHACMHVSLSHLGIMSWKKKRWWCRFVRQEQSLIYFVL
jgi:hypothetical protein